VIASGQCIHSSSRSPAANPAGSVTASDATPVVDVAVPTATWLIAT
jgi:hypothetical protein